MHAGGQGFESPQLHYFKSSCLWQEVVEDGTSGLFYNLMGPSVSSLGCRTPDQKGQLRPKSSCATVEARKPLPPEPRPPGTGMTNRRASFDGVAQLVEQVTVNHRVGGSSPSTVATLGPKRFRRGVGKESGVAGVITGLTRKYHTISANNTVNFAPVAAAA